MPIGTGRLLPGRRLGVAAISGLLLVGSAGVSGAATDVGAAANLPRAAADVNADSALTIEKGKPKTKKGKVYATLTYKFSNKGPTATAEGDLKTSALEGVTFDKVPKGCKKESNAAFCTFKPVKKGSTKTLKFTVVLTGTHHKVDAIGLGGNDPNIKNNMVALEWDTPKPAPKPSSKPPGSSPSSKPKPPDCPATRIEWSSDGGKTWKRSGLLGGFHPKLNVRLADKVADKCKYTVSYASYSAEGPTWKTSGKQGYLGKHTVTLTGKKPTAVLDISKVLPRCYGQVDLYGSGEKFDGKRLPHYPDKKFPTPMIAGWNGGKACTTPPSSSPPPSSPSASPSKSPSPSASTSTQPSTKPPTTTPGTTPSTTAPASTPPPTTPTPTPSATPTSTPTETPTTAPPPPVDTPEPPDEQAPVPDTPENPPSADDQRDVTEPPYVEGDLPRTGASRIPYLIALAVFSVMLGALAIAWSRWGPRGAFSRTAAPAPAATPWMDPPRNPRSL